jgi:hypothetical protein
MQAKTKILYLSEYNTQIFSYFIASKRGGDIEQFYTNKYTQTYNVNGIFYL